MLVVLPVVTLSIALLFATLFTQGGRGVTGASFYRVVFFFPQVMAVAIVGVLWNFVYHPTIGLANGFLKAVGLAGVQATWLRGAGTPFAGGGAGHRLAGPWLSHGAFIGCVSFGPASV